MGDHEDGGLVLTVEEELFELYRSYILSTPCLVVL